MIKETIEDRIGVLIDTLNAIAEKNQDEFSYHIDIGFKGKKPVYLFRAKETADGHDFISVISPTLEEMVAKATDAIPGACSSWGYKQ